MLIPPISIDMSDVLEEFNIPSDIAEELVDNVIKHITYRFYEEWSLKAGRELHSSRGLYIKSLQVLDEGKMKGAIILHGVFPNMIESGTGPYDMKEGFMKSDKIKYTKDGGWYLTIPFRFGASSSLGENEGFSNVMPKEVHEIAKKLTPTKTQFKGSAKLGETLKEISLPAKYQTKGKRGGVSDSVSKKTFSEYEHKTSIYTGIQKSEKTYQNATQSMYNSFRRVSSKSDPNSWIHSGLIARKLADKVLNDFNIAEEIDIATDNELSKLDL